MLVDSTMYLREEPRSGEPSGVAFPGTEYPPLLSERKSRLLGLPFVLVAFLLVMALPVSGQEEEEEEQPMRVDTVVEPIARFEDPRMIVELDNELRVRIYLRSGNRARRLTTREPPPCVDFVLQGEPVIEFETDEKQVQQIPLSTEIGAGRRTIVKASAPVPGGRVELKLHFDQQDVHPGILRVETTLQLSARSRTPIFLKRSSALVTELFTRKRQGGYWQFQGFGAEGNYQLEALPPGFRSVNLVTPTAGNQVPVLAFTDVWFPRGGLALGYFDLGQEKLFIPVEADDAGTVKLNLLHQVDRELRPGQSWTSAPMFVAVHEGDFFEPLRAYGRWMRGRYGSPVPSERTSYQPRWGFDGEQAPPTLTELRKKLPLLKELGIGWIVMDRHWFDAVGDWNPRREMLLEEEAARSPEEVESPGPGPKEAVAGSVEKSQEEDAEKMEGSFKKLVEELHGQGFRVRLRLSPHLVQPDPNLPLNSGGPGNSTVRLLEEHPDWIVRGEDGKPAVGPAGNYYLCLALDPVQRHLRARAAQWLLEWRVDAVDREGGGSVPACFDSRHHHGSPQDSTRAFPVIQQILSATAELARPESQDSPGEVTPARAWPPCREPRVPAGDSAVQLRLRVKVLRALCGDQVAVVSDGLGLNQFPSALGLGTVLGTRFNNFNGNDQAQYAKWMNFDRRLQINRGIYLSLYNQAFHSPEAHLIRRYGLLYYAFFTPKPGETFRGRVRFRGLTEGLRYRVIDYWNRMQLAIVTTKSPRLSVEFKDFLLLQLKPETPRTESQ